jgi:ubiquinone/menaquinone biosynthesis C-methylase UbiE
MEKKVMLSERHSKDNQARLERIPTHVSLEGKGDFLELGCGGGQVSRYFCENLGMNVTGTDVDPDMVEHAASRSADLENICFRTADATALPFEGSSFDQVLSFGILHHIYRWRDALSEVSRVLRSNGEYMMGDFAYSRFSRSLLAPFVRNHGAYTVNELVGEAVRSGLRVAHREPPYGSWFKYHAMVLREGKK